jgi:DNA topoisomerase-1
MTATERFTRPPSRYTEASLVKKLEELGIGRPSTYAPTISKIMEEGRGYVVKDSRDGEERKYQVLELKNDKINKKTETETTGRVRNRLFPTEMGITVSDFLEEHFEEIMDYSFTADIEKQLDDIAEGQRVWRDLLRKFYPPFHETVEETIKHADRPTRDRVLGKDPKTGRTLLTRMTRNGPVVQIGAPDELGEEEKPQYANLRKGQRIDTITYEEALELFKLPRDMGEYKGMEVSVGIGRYGPYVRFDNKFVSIPKDEDPLEITYERAVELIEAKLKEDAPVGEYKGEPITKGKGRYGPYLKYKDLYVSVPRKYDFDNLTQNEMHELIEKKLEKEANRYIKRWESDNIAVENGRWGPFIRYKKKSVKIPKIDGKRVTKEQAEELTLEQVKTFIEAELPGTFSDNKKGKKEKKSSKKKTSKKKSKS